MAENSQDPTKSTTEVKKIGSRASFPRLPLNKVLPLARQIYELGEGDPVPRLVVFDRLGKSPESGPSRMLITTSNAYGITTGSYQAERLGITDRGRNIVNSKDEQASRSNSVKTLLENELFSQFYEKYQNKGIPQEPVAVDFLKLAGNLSESDAKTAYEVFISNMTDYGFVKEMSGRPTIISQELMGLKSATETIVAQSDRDATPSTATQEASSDVRTSDQPTPVKTGAITPQFNFNIQVQLPENATADTYDAIFKSMAEHLLKNPEI